MATGKPLSRLSRKYSPGVFGYVRKQIVGKDKEERETEKTSVLQASGNLALRKYTAFYTRSCEDSVLFISTLAKDWSVVCIPSKENKGLYIPRCCVCVCVCVCVCARNGSLLQNISYCSRAPEMAGPDDCTLSAICSHHPPKQILKHKHVKVLPHRQTSPHIHT